MTPASCPYCALPILPVYDEHGDQTALRGFIISKCKSGHQFVEVPYERESAAGDQPTDQEKVAA